MEKLPKGGFKKIWKEKRRKEHRRNGKELRNEVSRIYKDIKGSEWKRFQKEEKGKRTRIKQ